ncbi:intradiol ring-cleavage dioxygenase [Thermodesulfobacteriota bacterium]
MKTHLLIKIFGALLLFVICWTTQIVTAGEQFVKTPTDYEGPFYPVTRQEDIDNDLVQVKGQSGVAQGDTLHLTGVVVNTGGEPRKGLTIEIWQTDPHGRYKHPGDSKPGERDPNFQYWGATTTGTDGTFFFKTIVPGAYNPRPAHIHYKVLQEGKVILTSQIYFKEPGGQTRLPSMTSQIELQTVDLKPINDGEFEAFFRIVL